MSRDGGMIARVVKKRQIIEHKSNALYGKFLTIHNGSGAVVGKINWAVDKEFIGMDWNDDENLVLVFENSDIEVYNVRGKNIVYI